MGGEVAISMLVLSVRSQQVEDVLGQVEQLRRFIGAHVTNLLVALAQLVHSAVVIVRCDSHLNKPLVRTNDGVPLFPRLSRGSQRHICSILHPAVSCRRAQFLAAAQVGQHHRALELLPHNAAPGAWVEPKALDRADAGAQFWPLPPLDLRRVG
eukprot:scaffold71334_cov28-Tisochrysis_lutea.AAC.1